MNDDEPRDMKGWLITVAWRKFLDRNRSESARSQREERAFDLDTSPHITSADDTVDLYFLCARPDLSPASAVALNRAVAIGEADGPVARLADLSRLDDGLPRYFAVEAHLRQRAGEVDVAAKLYVKAVAQASNLAERDHLLRQAARLNCQH